MVRKPAITPVLKSRREPQKSKGQRFEDRWRIAERLVRELREGGFSCELA
jgi:hypothetical protein